MHNSDNNYLHYIYTYTRERLARMVLAFFTPLHIPKPEKQSLVFNQYPKQNKKNHNYSENACEARELPATLHMPQNIYIHQVFKSQEVSEVQNKEYEN